MYVTKMSKIDKYHEQYNKMARLLLNEFVKSKKNENVVFSPYSIIMLLGIVAHATNEKTREEIINIIAPEMGIKEVEEIISEFQSVMNSSNELRSSNAVCVRTDHAKNIREEYADELANIFSGKLFTSENIVSDVNEWVKKHTKGMIDKIVEQSANDMLVCLINAIAFDVEWLNQYEEDDIFKGEFINADGSVSEVQMLESREQLFVENECFKGFLRPYKGRNYKYMGLLPKKKGTAFLEKAISTVDFAKLYKQARSAKVYVTMPEFKTDFGEELTTLCKSLGINKVFTTNADFSNMSSDDLMAESIFHRARIEVDRKGTKAAAVTAMCCFEGCDPMMEEYEDVTLDRPFVYAIINDKTGLPVFVGVTNQI